MSHKLAPPETAEQIRMAAFYKSRGSLCGWGRDINGNYFAPFARDAWAAWQEAQATDRFPGCVCNYWQGTDPRCAVHGALSA